MPKKKIIVRVATDEKRPGPTSKYKAEYVGIIARLAAQGYTLDQIAHFIGIAPGTLDRWIAAYPKLRDALIIPREVADNKVEMSLYGNANGRYYYEEEVKVIEGELVKVRLLKFQKPETLAQLAWLQNRRKDRWSRNPEPEIEAPPPPEEIEQDITPANARQIARKFALVLFKGGKEVA